MNTQQTTNTQTSTSNDIVLPLKKRKRLNDYDSTTTTAFPNANTNANAVKYKGVVKQHNGNYGAQIYTNHKRIWLGTFKSAIEAAMAYDSAAMAYDSTSINGFDSQRNFPFTNFTIQETNFQKHYTTENVLNMIKDGSYHRKFQDFLKIQPQNIKNFTNQRETNQESKNCSKITQLFEKELTSSDVGKLNRLVIPKKYAIKYLSKYKNESFSSMEEDMEIVLYDKGNKQWKFRYCYWKSSQSFVLTKGWISFVKEKNLKEKDVIVFYNCDVTNTLEGQNGQKKKILLIDIHRFSNDSFVVAERVTGKTKFGEEKTVMLFGVKIN